MKKEIELKMGDIIKDQLSELNELKVRKKLEKSLKEVLEMSKVTEAFKEMVIKEVHEVNWNTVEKIPHTGNKVSLDRCG